MEEEILELFLDYCNKGKYIDEYFLNQIFIIIAKYIDINEYLKKVKVDNKNAKNGTFYNSIDKILLFNLDFEHNKLIREKLNDVEYVYFYNLHVLRTIFHELEHIKQEIHKFGYEFDVKQKLIVLENYKPNLSLKSFGDKVKAYFKVHRYSKYYMEHHNLSPVERMANLEASREINSLMNKLKVKNDGILTLRILTELETLDQIRYGYHLVGDITNSPSIDYIIRIHEKACDKTITIDNSLKDTSMSLSDRLYYGLYLTKDEFTKLADDDYAKEQIMR